MLELEQYRSSLKGPGFMGEISAAGNAIQFP